MKLNDVEEIKTYLSSRSTKLLKILAQSNELWSDEISINIMIILLYEYPMINDIFGRYYSDIS